MGEVYSSNRPLYEGIKFFTGRKLHTHPVVDNFFFFWLQSHDECTSHSTPKYDMDVNSHYISCGICFNDLTEAKQCNDQLLMTSCAHISCRSHFTHGE